MYLINYGGYVVQFRLSIILWRNKLTIIFVFYHRKDSRWRKDKNVLLLVFSLLAANIWYDLRRICFASKRQGSLKVTRMKYNLISFIGRQPEELSGGQQKKRVIWRQPEELSGGQQKRRVIWRQPEELSGGQQKRRVIWR